MDEFLIESKTNAAEFTVSEISNALRRTVEDAFGNVRVRGEISGYRGPHSSGHAYFCLKDDRARLDAVVWKGAMGRLKFKPEEGMEVIATGKLTTYPGKSNYQIVIDNLEPAGAGALMALLEERKRRLAAEGLFDANRKQLLPYMPRVIGVITSPTGAVIRDIVQRIKNRFPLHVLVWPVRVQGDTCASEVTAAVNGFNALRPGGAIARPDLLIVARGGGSLEDLWGFNDEALARAVAGSDLPVISAVGHETDWTLVDLAADIRAPTPTAAAEMAAPMRAELEARLAGLGARLRGCVTRVADRKRTALRAAARALPSADQLLALPRRRFDDLTNRFQRSLSVNIDRKRARLTGARLQPTMLSRRIGEAGRLIERDFARVRAAFAGTVRDRRAQFSRSASMFSLEPVSRRGGLKRAALTTLAVRYEKAIGRVLERQRGRLAQAERLLATLRLSDRAILDRGYALVLDAEGAVIRRAAEVAAGATLSLRFSDGAAQAVAVGEGSKSARPKPVEKKALRVSQGSLF